MFKFGRWLDLRLRLYSVTVSWDNDDDDVDDHNDDDDGGSGGGGGGGGGDDDDDSDNDDITWAVLSKGSRLTVATTNAT